MPIPGLAASTMTKPGTEGLVVQREVGLERERESAEAEAASEREAALLRELSATTTKFEALFNQSGIFAGILDPQGYVREVNKLAMDACGYTKEQVLNRFPNYTGAEQSHADSAPPVFCHGKYSERVSKRES